MTVKQYTTYNSALKTLDHETLDSRRNISSLKFALKHEKNEKFNSWLKPATKNVNTRARDIYIVKLQPTIPDSQRVTKVLNMYEHLL